MQFKSSILIDGLHVVEFCKQEVEYNKPLYLGTTILDLSKLHMMKLRYDIIQPTFNDKFNILYHDADSLVYNIQHPDIYKWINNNRKHFDLSESIRPDLRDPTNEEIVGLMKDECKTKIITEFIALNPKVYTVNTLSDGSKIDNF